MQRLGEGLLKPLGIVLLKLMVFQNGHQEHFQHREIDNFFNSAYEIAKKLFFHINLVTINEYCAKSIRFSMLLNNIYKLTAF